MTLTIQDAITTIISAVPHAPIAGTADTVKIGDPLQPLTGIVTTFLANIEVIEAAVQHKANLIIAHEPLFYNHLDQADWLSNNAVYLAKRQLIEDNGLVVWRFHDYWHSLRPDPVMVGMVQALGWEAYVNSENYQCRIPPVTFRELVNHVKSKLDVPTVRVIGNLDMTCQTVALMPGFPPPLYQIGAFEPPEVDVLITGEIHEWETSEYARDAAYLRKNKALIVTEHAASEEPGIKAIGTWLQTLLPGTPVTFVPTSRIFQYIT